MSKFLEVPEWAWDKLTYAGYVELKKGDAVRTETHNFLSAWITFDIDEDGDLLGIEVVL